jgi:protein O-mannosyl-transferase
VIKALLNNRVCSICIILLLTLAAYSNIFPNDFVLDDFDFIVYWPLIQDWNNLPQFFLGYTPPAGQEGIFSPLKTLVHAINYHLFGLNPLGHHIFSIIVHSTAVFFVYQLSHDFTKNRTVAFLSALFFGLHPVHAGVVSSMTGSVDVLGMLFLFVSFYLYVKAQEQGAILNQKYYIGSLIAAFVAIFSHELTLSLPLLCIWYNLCF